MGKLTVVVLGEASPEPLVLIFLVMKRLQHLGNDIKFK